MSCIKVVSGSAFVMTVGPVPFPQTLETIGCWKTLPRTTLKENGVELETFRMWTLYIHFT